MFSRILIANRAEIACRVIRSARRLGYSTVAVFSDADAGALHVQQADAAVRIGPAPAVESYLHIDRLLAAARASGADAVHPGYGFLSERADFAQACADAGLVFIGPPPAAICAMGDKAEAKRRMRAAGVPCAPGWAGDDQSDDRLIAEATRLGLPLLVKAVAGGGGRGMRRVLTAAELPAAIAGARREAMSAFGDDTLMLERLIEPGRHIEVQVFVDAHGNAVHLGERDCSTQRRRQKVIEEAPSPHVDEGLRSVLGRDALAAALAVGYRGAGTVEFIVDADQQHYFLEMNTRLQVEHPVTECVTGFDLVEWQLRIAAGEPLPVTQEQIRFSGHAIEARLYAEDPYDGFKPQTGRVLGWNPDLATRASDAQAGAFGGVRIDHGIAVGGEVTPWYDPMLAKFVAHGRDRADAVRRLRQALAQVPLFGVVNNGGFLRDLLAQPEFADATLHTTSLDDAAQQGAALFQRPAPPEASWRLACALFGHVAATAFRPTSVAAFDLTLECRGIARSLRCPPQGVALLGSCGDEIRYAIDGMQGSAIAHRAGSELHLALDGQVFVFKEPSAWPQLSVEVDPRRVRSPVAGSVAQISVAVGDAVAAGQPLVCIEAMKIEMWLNAPAAAKVRAVRVALREAVAAGRLLVELEVDE